MDRGHNGRHVQHLLRNTPSVSGRIVLLRTFLCFHSCDKCLVGDDAGQTDRFKRFHAIHGQRRWLAECGCHRASWATIQHVYGPRSEAVAHLAEEVADAGVVAPKAMVISLLGNLPFTFVLLITQVSAPFILSRSLTDTSYAFCIGDVDAALSSTTGLPFIYVLQNATESVVATTGFVIVVLVLLVMITISALASSSRQLFALARDDGLPLSKWLGAVSTSLFQLST